MGNVPPDEGDSVEGLKNTMNMWVRQCLFLSAPFISEFKQNQVIRLVCFVVLGLRWGPLGSQMEDIPPSKGDRVRGLKKTMNMRVRQCLFLSLHIISESNQIWVIKLVFIVVALIGL